MVFEAVMRRNTGAGRTQTEIVVFSSVNLKHRTSCNYYLMHHHVNTVIVRSSNLTVIFYNTLEKD